jgi:hypothetical protein
LLYCAETTARNQSRFRKEAVRSFGSTVKPIAYAPGCCTETAAAPVRKRFEKVTKNAEVFMENSACSVLFRVFRVEKTVTERFRFWGDVVHGTSLSVKKGVSNIIT